MLVIERLSHGQARGAPPLAVLSSFGTITGAHHVTAGWEDRREAARAIEIVLVIAEVEPGQIDYVNAYVTSPSVGDAAELAALIKVFGANGGGFRVVSTKSATGHILGAPRAIETVFSVRALRDQVCPPG